MVSHWSLSDSMSPRLFSVILANLTNVEVLMVSTRPLISKSSSSWTNSLVTVPSAPIRIGVTVTVTYWPSTEPSIKRCTCVNKQRNSGNRCIRSKISKYHLDLWTWLNSVQMRTPTRSRWVSNNYITRRRLGGSQFEFSSSCSWSQLGTRCQRENQLADWGLAAPTDPRLSSPARMRKKCCYGQRNFGSICCSLSPSPTHLSHITNFNPFATLSRIKCEKYIFIKKCVRSFIEVVHYCWLCFCL